MWILKILKFYVWLALYFCWTTLAWLINGFASFCSSLTFSARSLLSTLSKSAPFPSTLQLPSLIYFASRHFSPQTYNIFYLLIFSLFSSTRLPFKKVFCPFCSLLYHHLDTLLICIPSLLWEVFYILTLMYLLVIPSIHPSIHLSFNSIWYIVDIQNIFVKLIFQIDFWPIS